MLDAVLIRRRRAELGLSARTVATHLKVSPSVVVALEAGTNHAELSLAHLHRLADILALEVTTLLLAAHPKPSPGPVTDADCADDAAQLGAALPATGVLTPLDALSDAFSWNAERLQTALDALERALPGVGLRLHRLRGGVALARSSEPIPAEVLAAVIRKHLNRDGITLAEGRILYRYLAGNPPRDPNNSERVATGVLTNAELLTPDPDDQGHLQLCDDVRFSLLLDEEPDPTGAPLYQGSRRFREQNRVTGKTGNRGTHTRLPQTNGSGRTRSAKKPKTTPAS